MKIRFIPQEEEMNGFWEVPVEIKPRWLTSVLILSCNIIQFPRRMKEEYIPFYVQEI
jgi:hypothetical protein